MLGRDEAGVIGRQEQHRGRDLVGRGGELREERRAHLVENRIRVAGPGQRALHVTRTHRGVDSARVDAVHADLVLAQLGGEGARHAGDGVLAGRVVDHEGLDLLARVRPRSG